MAESKRKYMSGLWRSEHIIYFGFISGIWFSCFSSIFTSLFTHSSQNIENWKEVDASHRYSYSNRNVYFESSSLRTLLVPTACDSINFLINNCNVETKLSWIENFKKSWMDRMLYLICTFDRPGFFLLWVPCAHVHHSFENLLVF